MGFFSFGKKKKDVAPAKAATSPPVATPAKSHLRRPSNLVNSASASSSLSAASSGSSDGSPPQPIRSHTFSGTQDRSRRSLSFSPEAMVPPVPRTPGSHSRAGSSTSLSAPNAPYANRDLRKMGSTNTLNSTKSSASASKRGAHDAPRIAPELAALGTAKPRAYSYHASQVGGVWVASDVGHSTATGHPPIQAPNGAAKYYSTGSPGLMNRGSSYFNGQQSSLPQHQQQHAAAVSDAEFKIYAKKYDMAIAKAHTLAREYHHLPPAKRDRPRFEHIGNAFTAAARISREQWSYRCRLEKERLEALLESTHGQPSEADIKGDEFSIHRVAGSRATEGWQYASMLADAWGMKEEVAGPLEEMPILKPNYQMMTSYSSSPSYYGDRSPAYLHPGYAQGGYASYIAQPLPAAASSGEFAIPKLPRRDRINSSSSAAPSFESYGHSSSSHTHSGLSHSLHHSQSHHALSTPSASASAATTTALSSYSVQSSYIPSPLNSTVVEETVVRAPIKLTKGKRYRERGSSLGGAAAAVTVA